MECVQLTETHYRTLGNFFLFLLHLAHKILMPFIRSAIVRVEKRNYDVVICYLSPHLWSPGKSVIILMIRRRRRRMRKKYDFNEAFFLLREIQAFLSLNERFLMKNL